MAEQLAPGVKVTRMPSQIQSIQGVGTSVGAFEGLAEKGPIGVATLITSWSDFVIKFGTYTSYSYLAYAVYSFFANGGSRCYVVRTGHYSDIDAGTLDVTANVTAHLGPIYDSSSQPTLTIYANSPGDWANYSPTGPSGLQVKCGRYGPYDSSTHFSVYVYYKGDLLESFEYMNMDDTSSDYCETRINGVSNYIVVDDLDSTTPAPGNIPHLNPYAFPLAGGVYDYSVVTDTDYIGSSAGNCGLYAFDDIDEINLLSVPGIIGTLAAVQKAIITYCENRSSNADGVFGVCDTPQNYNTQNIRDWRMNNLASEYAGVFWPWLQIKDPRTGRLMYVPPSGHVQGKASKVAQFPGTHQAFAGVDYGTLRGVLGLQFNVASVTTDIKSPGEQDSAVLNPVGVNVIRFFEGYGFLIWGSRTMSPSSSDYLYIPVSRYFLYIEESVKKGLLWVIQHTNDPKLRRQVEQAVTTFLYNEWKAEDAIDGMTKEEAFYVTCDDSNNAPSTIRQGKLYVDIGIKPKYPVEFLHVRIGVWDGGSSAEILKRDQISDYVTG